jgi:hypothetical protein
MMFLTNISASCLRSRIPGSPSSNYAATYRWPILILPLMPLNNDLRTFQNLDPSFPDAQEAIARVTKLLRSQTTSLNPPSPVACPPNNERDSSCPRSLGPDHRFGLTGKSEELLSDAIFATGLGTGLGTGWG